MRCKADNNIFDLGFATTPQMSLDIESLKQQFKVEHITLENSSQELCNQLTPEKGYHGNSLKELDCFLFNISKNNRHFSYAWTSLTEYRNTVSERLCYTGMFLIYELCSFVSCNRGLSPGQVKPMTIQLVRVVSPLSTQH
jgi:hypothetical protein